MPRPKGFKNKAPRKITVANNDFEALIAEKTLAKENFTEEIAFLEENLTGIKSDLKAKKPELKKLDTELVKLEEQKAVFYARKAEEAKKAEQEDNSEDDDLWHERRIDFGQAEVKPIAEKRILKPCGKY